MTLAPRVAAAATIALMIAGCAPSHPASPATKPKPSRSASTAASSVFCRELTGFQAVAIVYWGDPVEATRGKALNFKQLRGYAATIARKGKKMQASAPPQVADDLRTVRSSVKKSVRHLKDGAPLSDLMDPLYNKKSKAALDAIMAYRCH